jgi:hypothetical protein
LVASNASYGFSAIADNVLRLEVTKKNDRMRRLISITRSADTNWTSLNSRYCYRISACLCSPNILTQKPSPRGDVMAKVLIVQDERSLAEVLSMMLAIEGSR